MAIAFDSANKTAFASTDGSNQRTLSHTCTGTDLGLIVFIRNNANSDTLTGVTYNGVSMNQALKFHETGGNSAYVYIYTLTGPTTGTNNIVASFSGAETVTIFSHSYTGVSQTSMVDATSSGSATASSLTLSTTTVADNCWVATQFRAYAANETASTGFTTRNTKVDGGISGDNNAAKTPPGAVTERITCSNGYVAAVGISIAPSVAGAAKSLAALGVG